MVLMHAAVMPHGAMVLDPHMPGLPSGARALGDACRDAAQRLSDSHPDLVVLTTPHGISLPDAVAIYGNDELNGTAEWQGGWSGYGVHADGDAEAGASLLACLRDGGLDAELVTAFSAGVAAPLRWGEAVPMWFLQDIGLLKRARVLVVSWPSCRQRAVQFTPTALRCGQLLRTWAASTMGSRRVALLASCDMSHVHKQPPHTNQMFGSSAFTPRPECAAQFGEQTAAPLS
eukprot:COSAG01_NODE_2275_length_8019_cov_79.308838_1_plen_231_part_00